VSQESQSKFCICKIFTFQYNDEDNNNGLYITVYSTICSRRNFSISTP